MVVLLVSLCTKRPCVLPLSVRQMYYVELYVVVAVVVVVAYPYVLIQVEAEGLLTGGGGAEHMADLVTARPTIRRL